MAKVLDALKEPLNKITLFVQVRIKIMLNPEIGFVGDTSNGSVLSEENANLLATYALSASIFLPLSCMPLRREIAGSES